MCARVCDVLVGGELCGSHAGVTDLHLPSFFPPNLQETDCENYIKFVQAYPNDPGRLLVCGTFSLYRACLTLNVCVRVRACVCVCTCQSRFIVSTVWGMWWNVCCLHLAPVHPSLLQASLALTPGESITLDSGVDTLNNQFGFFAQRASDNSVVTFVGNRRSGEC